MSWLPYVERKIIEDGLEDAEGRKTSIMSFQAKGEGEERDLASLDVNDPLDFCYLPAKMIQEGQFHVV